MLRIIRLCALLIFIPSISFAQTDSIDKALTKFSIGVTYSPQSSYRVTGNDSYDFWDDYEIPNYGYSTGLNFIYRLNEKFSLESGLLYSDKGWQFDISKFNFGDIIDPRYGGLPYEHMEAIEKISTHIYYLDVPVKFGYSSRGRKFRFITSAGGVLNIFLEANEQFEYADGFKDKLKFGNSFNKVGVSLIIDAGVEYFFNKKISLRLLPEYQYSITTLTGSALDTHLFSVGINSSFNYRF